MSKNDIVFSLDLLRIYAAGSGAPPRSHAARATTSQLHTLGSMRREWFVQPNGRTTRERRSRDQLAMARTQKRGALTSFTSSPTGSSNGSEFTAIATRRSQTQHTTTAARRCSLAPQPEVSLRAANTNSAHVGAPPTRSSCGSPGVGLQRSPRCVFGADQVGRRRRVTRAGQGSLNLGRRSSYLMADRFYGGSVVVVGCSG